MCVSMCCFAVSSQVLSLTYRFTKTNASHDWWLQRIGWSSECVRGDSLFQQKVLLKLPVLLTSHLFASSCLTTSVWSRDTREDSGVTAATWAPPGCWCSVCLTRFTLTHSGHSTETVVRENMNGVMQRKIIKVKNDTNALKRKEGCAQMFYSAIWLILKWRKTLWERDIDRLLP